MKNLLFTILFAFTMSVNAQYYSLTYVTVPPENQEEFVRLETQYWSKVAKHNVEAGKQIAWGLVQAVGGVPNGWTHVFVNVYETAEQLADSSIWDPETILKRLKNNSKRPVAINLTSFELMKLIKKRSSIYSKALYSINCDGLSKKQIVNKVKKIYETNKINC